MVFALNQRIVYPAHGVAVVDAVVTKAVAGREINFYKLTFLYKDMTILIPVDGTAHGGMRPLSDPAALDGAMGRFSERIAQKKFDAVDVSPSAWNKRHKEYQARLMIGSFDAMLDIYGELMQLAQGKDLSFGEKGLLQTAEDLLAQEMMESKLIGRTESLELLRTPFKQFVVTYTPHHLHNTVV